MKPAIFLDRDGTLNYDCPYCRNESEIRMYEDIYTPLEKLSEDYYIIIVTNQSGVGRGYFSLEDMKRMNDKVRREIEFEGGRVDAIYSCPHKPEDNCACRKPKTGLIDQALKDFDIDLRGSFFIGDDDKDMILAKRMGIKSICVRRRGNEVPDFYAEDFYEALKIIEEYQKSGFYGD